MAVRGFSVTREQVEVLENTARQTTSKHKAGCSCGAPECPQYQASALGVPYDQVIWQKDYVDSQLSECRYCSSDNHVGSECPWR